ncbi:hypothetical protein D3C80_2216810 [compost metagenome]
MIAVLLQTSKALPWRTALAIPRGIDTRYMISVLHRPSEIDTGIFSTIRSMTLASRKKLSPKSSWA